MKKYLLTILVITTLIQFQQISAQSIANYDWMNVGLGFGRPEGLNNIISKVDSEGNLFNAGSEYGMTDFMFIHKISPLGITIWKIDNRTSVTHEGKILDLIVDEMDNIYVAGYYFTAFPPTETDTLFVKKIISVDDTPQVEWEYRHLIGDDYINIINREFKLAKHDSSIVVTGITLNRETLADLVTIKLDPNGNEIWKRNFTNGENYDLSPKDIAVDNVGNVYVFGNSVKEDSSKAQLIKYSSNGELLWNKTISNPDNPNIYAVDVEVSDGFSWISANSESFTFLIKYDSLGNIIAEIVRETSWNNIGISLDTQNNIYQICSDSIFKYNSFGNILLANSLPSIENVQYTLFDVDADQNMVVVGERTLIYPSRHFYTTQINKNLEVEAAFETTWQDSPTLRYSSSTPHDIAVSSKHGIFISGLVIVHNYYDSLNYDASSRQVSIKYSKLPTNIRTEEIEPNNFNLSQNYPNPFNPSTIIKYTIPSDVKSETANVKLKVYDVLGKEVATLINKEQSAGSYEVEFSAKGLSSGVYFYTLRTESFVETKKMILLR